MGEAVGFWRDDEGRLRSGWRVVLWLGMVAALLVGSSLLGLARLPLTLAHLVRLALVAIASLVAWRVLDGRAPPATWLALDRDAARALGLGFLVGMLLVGLALLPLAILGSFEILARECRVEQQGRFLLSTGLLLLVAAAIEELLFRGYPLFALESGPGRAFAVAFTSVVFALLHAGNPHYGATAAITLAGIGAVLAVSVLQRRSLWEAVGAHVGWNWMLAAGLALPVSGLAMPSPCYSGALSGPTWLTGGGFGLEAGVPALGAWALAAVGLWWRARRGRGGPKKG